MSRDSPHVLKVGFHVNLFPQHLTQPSSFPRRFPPTNGGSRQERDAAAGNCSAVWPAVALRGTNGAMLILAWLFKLGAVALLACR